MDGLRAIAALFVFSVHFNQMVRLEYTAGPFDIAKLMANGNHGVSLFFSLSGFLLSLPFWRAFFNAKPLPDFRKYLIRRLARIIPGYYLLLTLLVFVGRLWEIPGAWFDIVSHYLMVFNFTEFTIFSINPPFWTLAVELQFYLLLPALFLCLKTCRNKKKVIFILCSLILAVCGIQYTLIHTIDRVISWPFNPWLTWIRPHGAVLNHSLTATLPHFLAGCIAGCLFQTWQSRNRVPGSLISHGEKIFWSSLMLVFICLSTGWISDVGPSFIPYGFPIIPLLLVCLIITVPFTRIAGKILECPVFKSLGKISYGIYLYHYPCLMFLEWQMRQKGLDVENHWILFGCAGLAITIVTALFSYILIERPSLRLVRRK